MVMVVISAASFAWGVIQPMSNPQVSYLSTLTRVWELGAGGLLYFGNRWWAQTPTWARWVLGWGGLLAFLLGSAVLTPATPYPGVAALIPVLATAAIIIAGVGAPSPLVVVTNPVAGYFGRISYSAYLWHWPVFVFAAALFGKDSPVYLWGAIPVSLLLAAASFHFVESPVRRSNFLEPRKKRHRSSRREGGRAPAVIAAVCVVVAVLAVTVAVSGRSREAGTAASPRPLATATEDTPPVTPTSVPPVDPAAEIAGAVTAALATPDWPAVVVEQIDSGQVSSAGLLSDVCLDVMPETEDQCIIGGEDLPMTAVVVGDSVAVSWLPGLAPALNALGYRVRVLTHSQCPFADVSVSGSPVAGSTRPGYPDECNTHRAWAFDRIAEISPQLVVAGDGEAEMSMLMTPADTPSTDYWRDGLLSSAARVAPIPLVVLSSPPQASSIAECYTRTAGVAACTERVGRTWSDQFASTEAAVAAEPSIKVVQTRDWFCSPEGWCPPFVDNIVVRADRQHLTGAYAKRLAVVIQNGISKALGSS